MTKPLINIRQMETSDHDFIFSSWMRSYRKGSKEAKALDWLVYRHGQTHLITKLLLSAEVLVASNPEHDDQIFGYIVFTEFDKATALHWIYVKETFRKWGIGDQLFKAATAGTDHDLNDSLFATHKSHNFAWLSKKWKLRYNPYLAHEANHESNRNHASRSHKAA